MPTPEKNETVDKLTEVFKRGGGVFLADFSGMSVDMMNDLRQRCDDESVTFKVVKNTLALRASQAAGMPDLSPHFIGSTALAYAEEPARAVKLLRQFVKDVRESDGKPEIKTGLVDGHVLSDAELDMLAKLPPTEVVYAQFLGLLKAPAGKLVGLLAAAPGSLVRALDQRRQKLEEEETQSNAAQAE
jgi:large subunit ribosomal protein L10